MWKPVSMEMGQKGCEDSGSLLGNSESGSPPSSGGAFGGSGGGGGGGLVPGIIDLAVNINMEKNAGMTKSRALAGFVGGGGISGGGGGGGLLGGGPIGVSGEGVGQPAMGRKKRGRPRKYDLDGNLRASYVRSPPPQQPGFSLSTPPSYHHSSWPKKGRAGELLANTAGEDFTPHVLTVYTGEDVTGKILTFAQKGSRGVCVLSANGSVSNVTIRQPGSSGGLFTYEGRFEILTLTGSYSVFDNDGIKSRAGGLSVSLASPDGRVIGGCLAGSLMAATPIQVVIGSFLLNGSQMPNRKQQSSAPFQYAPATVTAAVPISQALPESDTYQMPTASLFPLQSSRREADVDHTNSASTDDTSDWNDFGPGPDQRPYPDINVSIPSDEGV